MKVQAYFLVALMFFSQGNNETGDVIVVLNQKCLRTINESFTTYWGRVILTVAVCQRSSYNRRKQLRGIPEEKGTWEYLSGESRHTVA
ncbi:hypothetical protein V6N13_095226 [Hibiscus sabdariffa]